jgi:hypothetical protein
MYWLEYVHTLKNPKNSQKLKRGISQILDPKNGTKIRNKVCLNYQSFFSFKIQINIKIL